MSSMLNIAKQNLRLSKTRNILTIMAITLTTCLLTSIGILSFSIHQMVLAKVVEQTGTSHGTYLNLTPEQLEILRNHNKIETITNQTVPSTQMPEESKEGSKSNVTVRVKSTRNISQTVMEIGRNIGLTDENIKVNSVYIQALGGDLASLIPFLVIGAVVISAAVIVIYNIFHISVVYRINQFGLLSALGGTKRQIRKIIFFEGLRISSLGIPLGLVSGYVISVIVIPLLSVKGLAVKSSPSVFLAAAAVSLLTVIIAVWKPAKIAAGISPVEAIRYSGFDIKVNKRKRNVRRNVTIGWLAWLNLWRNKKRTVMTMVSLIMSGTLFLVFSTILTSMNLDNLTKSAIPADFQLTADTRAAQSRDPLNNSILNQIQSQDGITEVNTIRHHWIFLDASDKRLRSLNLPAGAKGITELKSDLYGFDNKLLSEQIDYLIEGEPSLNSLESENLVLAVADDTGKSLFNPGDIIKVPIKGQDQAIQNVELRIAGIVSKNISWIGFSGIGPTFIGHSALFDRIGIDSRIDRININVDQNKYDSISQNLHGIVNESNLLALASQKEFKEEREKELRGMQTAAMSLVGIIAIIGLLNLINTMITSMLTRQKEIGILQAVGLSNSQLRRMFQIEGLYYGVTSALISVLLGTGIGYITFLLFSEAATYAEFRFPLLPIVLVVTVFSLVQVFITFLVEKRLLQDTIIDRIRYHE